MVKLVVVEDGSDLAARLWGSAYPAASSILAYPEGRAALAAAQRLGRLGKDAHKKALVDFEKLYADLVTIAVDREFAARAGEYAEDLKLRGYDSVHLPPRSNWATRKSFLSPGIEISRRRLSASASESLVSTR